MADDESRVKFGADIGELTAGMEQSADAVKGATEKMDSSLAELNEKSEQASQRFAAANKEMAESAKKFHESAGSAYEKMEASVAKVQNVFIGLASAVAGGEMFKEIIESTTRWTEQVASLSHTLGITMEKASDLNASLRIVGISSDQYENILRQLSMRLRMNEAGMQAMGMATRDASGHLVDGQQAIQNALDAIQRFKAGTDQTTVAEFFFGRGTGDLTRILELNAEVMKQGREEARRLGLEVGTSNYEATVKYEESVNNLDLALTAIWKEVGVYLIPVLKDLADLFAGRLPHVFDDIGSKINDMVQKLKDAFAWWQKFFNLTKNNEGEYTPNGVPIAPGGGLIWEKGKGIVEKAGPQTGGGPVEIDPLTGLPMLPKEHPGYRGIALGSGTETASQKQMDIMRRTSQPKGAGKGGAGGAAEDMVAAWQQAEERIKDSQQDLYSWSAEKDFAFWNEKLAETKKGSAQWWQIWHKMADDLRQMTKEQERAQQQQAHQAQALAAATAAMAQSDAQTAIRMEEEKINTLYRMGRISASQKDAMLQAEYQKQYDLTAKALYGQLALLQQQGDKTIAQQARVWAELERLHNQYLLRMQKDEDRSLLDQQKRWENYSREASSALSGLLFHHQTILQTMQSYEERFFNYVIDALLKKLVAQWLMGEQAKTAATVSGAMAREAAESAGVGSSLVAEAAEALKSIATSAATTFAGIFGFLSPEMGPAAAGPAAGGMAAVLSMEGMVASAEGGWDVPADSLVNVHKQEMVLPAHLAERVRGMTEPGGGGGDMFQVSRNHIHIHGEGLQNASRRNTGDLMKAISRGIRDNHLKWRS